MANFFLVEKYPTSFSDINYWIAAGLWIWLQISNICIQNRNRYYKMKKKTWNNDINSKEDKEEAQCAQKWGRMLFFVIYGIIKNVLPNFYFILQIYQVKSFKMMHFMSQYFNFSIRYSWKCSKKLIELRLLSNYYPD